MNVTSSNQAKLIRRVGRQLYCAADAIMRAKDATASPDQPTVDLEYLDSQLRFAIHALEVAKDTVKNYAEETRDAETEQD